MHSFYKFGNKYWCKQKKKKKMIIKSYLNKIKNPIICQWKDNVTVKWNNKEGSQSPPVLVSHTPK